jgi:predicted glycoside hydrolase/deacetylase ChbG (UPF0249 family)
MTTDGLTKVIVNADDFGLTEGVNRAVARCFEAGSVSSTTLVVTGDAAEDAAQLATSMPGLGVGLHFNLTLGRPLSNPDRVASLVGAAGDFSSRSRLLMRWLLGTLDQAEIRSELETQVKRFRGLWPEMSHVDSHQHVHMIPPVFEVVSNYCRERRLPMRIPWPRGSFQSRRDFSRRVRVGLLEQFVKINTRSCAEGLSTNKAFASVFDICDSPGDISQAVYESLLESVHVTPFELMVHPAIVDRALRNLTKICDYSEREFHLLSRKSILEMTERNDIHVVNYRDAFAV